MVRENVGQGVLMLYADGNRVEGSHITGQIGSSGSGIVCGDTARNLIAGNSCEGQTNNYSMSSNDTYGPIVTATGALAATGTSAHAWANFSR